MNSKLTLSIDKEIIEQAKEYARQTGRSLSNIIENYLRSLTNDTGTERVGPRTKRMYGAVSERDDTEIKEEYSEYLRKKHLR